MKGITTSEWARVAHLDRVSRILGELLYLELFGLNPKTKADVKIFIGPDDIRDRLLVHYSGQITSTADLPDISRITREFLNEIGYGDYGLRVISSIATQSDTLRDNSGIGDSRAIYGYFQHHPIDSESGLCLSHWLAREISRRLDGYPNLREYPFEWLLPDGKVQVTASLDEVYLINICAQHRPDIKVKDVREAIREEIIRPLLEKCNGIGIRYNENGITVNSAGPFTDGASNADTAIGNKDGNLLYGGVCPCTDLEFYGRDIYKPDKTGSLWLRYVCRCLADDFETGSILAHSPWILGQDRARIFVDILDNKSSCKEIERYIEGYEVPLAEIISTLDLQKLPIELYRRATIWGPYGEQFPWDR